MKEDEIEQTKTGSWPEVRSVGEDLEEDTDAENDQELQPEDEK